MEKVWEIASKKFENIIDQLLYNRGVIEDNKDTDKKEKFFHPDFDKDLFDPFLMKGIRKAVERIDKAIKEKEIIGIFADYDADGIPGAALLYKALTKLELEVVTHIPNRETGYGLNKEGIDYLIEKKCTLIITVDLGIRNFEEAVYCGKKNIDLIITDHHTPDDKVPSGFLVINPKISDDKYPYKELSGCGVVFKLIQGISKKFPKDIDESFLKWNLDLVAISTISDVVPLNGENRILAQYGLIVLNKTKNIGLKELIKVSGIKGGSIGAYETGYQLGPRINAPGRIDHATKSFELLTTEDEKHAKELSIWLDKKNELRQKAMGQVEKEATKKISDNEMTHNSVIVIAGSWPKGVIGPTASRISDKYFRPTILFAEDGDKLVGSARSVGDINILEILKKAEKHILKYGGHKGAAGLTVLKDQFIEFQEKITNYANSKIGKESFVKKIKVDSEVKIDELDLKLCYEIKKLEPFGMGNRRPVFMLTDTELKYVRYVGKQGQYLSCHVQKGNKAIKSICFNLDKNNDILEKESVDVAFNLDLNEWNNTKKLNLNIIDIKNSNVS